MLTFGTELLASFEMGIKLSAMLLVVSLIFASILGRIIEGDLVGVDVGIALLFVAGLFVAVVFLWNSPLIFAVFLIAFGLVVFWLFVQSVIQKRLVFEMRMEEEARYKASIERDQNNAAAWSFLGDFYLEDRHYDKAVSCYEKAVQIVPHSIEEQAKLRRARKLKAEAEAKGKFCPKCKTLISRFAITCPQCGEEMNVPIWVYLFEATKDSLAMRKVLLGFFIAFPIATFSITLLFLLPPYIRIVVVLSILSAIVIVVMRSLL